MASSAPCLKPRKWVSCSWRRSCISARYGPSPMMMSCAGWLVLDSMRCLMLGQFLVRMGRFFSVETRPQKKSLKPSVGTPSGFQIEGSRSEAENCSLSNPGVSRTSLSGLMPRLVSRDS